MRTDTDRAVINTLKATHRRSLYLESEKSKAASARGEAVCAAYAAGFTTSRIARILGVGLARVAQLRKVGES